MKFKFMLKVLVVTYFLMREILHKMSYKYMLLIMYKIVERNVFFNVVWLKGSKCDSAPINILGIYELRARRCATKEHLFKYYLWSMQLSKVFQMFWAVGVQSCYGSKNQKFQKAF